jgi:hypothetical protein
MSDTYEAAERWLDLSVRFTFHQGWGVSVLPICAGDDEPDPDRIVDIEVGVARITGQTVKLLGGQTLCVPFDVDSSSDPQCWVPVDNFKPEHDWIGDDQHDLRAYWFATESEAREHAESVKRQWADPLPWQSFVTLD